MRTNTSTATHLPQVDINPNSGGTPNSAALPAYAAELDAFHQAYVDDLRTLIAKVPLAATNRVIDIGCGDGFYARLFAERLHPPGSVVGIDADAEYLNLARSRTPASTPVEVRFVQADWRSASSLIEDRCDVVWCAQSLFSFAEPEAALKSMAKLAKPGGMVAVLENDTLHQLLMPWSSRMEMALRAAEREAFEQESEHAGKYYVGRRLPSVMAQAGLTPLGYCTQAIDRMAPLAPALKKFLQSYLEKLYVRTGPFISNELRNELADLIDPTSERYLVSQPHFTVTWLNVLAWARRT